MKHLARAISSPSAISGYFESNRLLTALCADDRALLGPFLKVVEIDQGEVLFEPGEEVETTHFPCVGAMVSLVLVMEDGRHVEAATIGHEGAVGGIVSAGRKPAFPRGVMQIGGLTLRIPTVRLEDAKIRSPSLRESVREIR